MKRKIKKIINNKIKQNKEKINKIWAKIETTTKENTTPVKLKFWN
jgi:hypothetical protein